MSFRPFNSFSDKCFLNYRSRCTAASVCSILLFCICFSTGISAAQIKGENTGQNLTFTFYSPLQKWTPQEIQHLQSFISEIYPVALDVYGAPAFSINVNIRKDTTLQVSGLYDPGTNELTVRNSEQLTTVCHEVLHAFRDDCIILSDVYEEGMVRAAEIEIFNRLEKYRHWDEFHSYFYDYYYETLNKQSIGIHGGSFMQNPTLALLRYHIASYAWAKLLIEDTAFLKNFNDRYRQEYLKDRSVSSDISRLKKIVFEIKHDAEGLPVDAWYSRQGIFNDSPAAGTILFQRINQFDVVLFDRDEAGREVLRQNAPVNWMVYDYRDSLLNSGSGMTGPYGWMDIPAMLPPSYTGMLKVITTTASSGPAFAADTAYRTSGVETGLFGVLASESDLNGEKVSAEAFNTSSGSLSRTIGRFETRVINGAFSFPELDTVRGSIRLSCLLPDGKKYSKVITKDKSRYFVLLRRSDMVVSALNSAEAPEFSTDLGQNYPNPFNPETVITFQIAENSSVSLKLYDVLGREIAELLNSDFGPGEHSYKFDSGVYNLPSGVYIYSLYVTNTMGRSTLSKKMTLAK